MRGTDYTKALKAAKKEVAQRTAKGENPYLPALDDIPEAANSVMEYPLGLVQIPLAQIVGTKTDGRSHAFAANFMPLLREESEFSMKWENLCEAHLEEGIRDPIKAYEFMNKFYVLEGNKRVSVLKYFGAVSIPGEVIRIVPYRTDTKENKIYYEFMDFYKLSLLNDIYFSECGSFSRLQRLVGKKPDEEWTDDDRMNFRSLFVGFEKAYQEKAEKKTHLTAADALLEFLEIYGYEAALAMTPTELEDKILKAEKAFLIKDDADSMQIKMDPDENKSSIWTKLLGGVPSILKIGFVHEVDPHKSGWTYAHDLGYSHLEQIFGNKVKLSKYIAKNYESQEEAVETAIRDGNDIIFTTSPVLYKASLKMAVEHPEVKILNCSLLSGKGVLRNYNARMYEAKFIMGAIAGALAENNRVGYIADYPIYGTIANINAFALGAKMINPRVTVFLDWQSRKTSDIRKRFGENNVSCISGRDIIIPGREGSRRFGLFEINDQSPYNYAMPVWNWGKFYEKIIANILDGTWKESESEQKSLNYWWGMSTGVIDVVYSHNLPVGTMRLIELLKKTICAGEFNPFSGILYSQDGVIQNEEETLTAEKIITMDWLCENVAGSIPKMEDLREKAKPVVMQQGVDSTVESVGKTL